MVGRIELGRPGGPAGVPLRARAAGGHCLLPLPLRESGSGGAAEDRDCFATHLPRPLWRVVAALLDPPPATPLRPAAGGRGRGRFPRPCGGQRRHPTACRHLPQGRPWGRHGRPSLAAVRDGGDVSSPRSDMAARGEPSTARAEKPLKAGHGRGGPAAASHDGHKDILGGPRCASHPPPKGSHCVAEKAVCKVF